MAASCLLGSSADANTSWFLPYIDPTGYLLVVPYYGDKTTTAGGPSKQAFNVIPTAPTVTVNGAGVTATPIPPDNISSFFGFLLATKVNPGDTVTMSCADGWASAVLGTVAGT